MNLLTHLFLSGNSPAFVVGSYINEIKSLQDFSDYPDDLQTGIRYHELINEFIHTHPVVARSRKRINSKYSKYSYESVVSFYNHFLAANWHRYSDLSLEKFANQVYHTLLDYHSILPYKAKATLPLMIQGNWLVKQANVSGINQIVKEMQVKSSRQTYTINALEDLIACYHEFQQDFEEFFPDLIQYANGLQTLGEIRESERTILAMAG